MALYRCAACGSPNVVTDTQANGVEYNYLKGAVGTVVLGAGGAVAGVQNKTQQVFKCPDCGTVLSYSMERDVKNAIDLGVLNADARDNLTLYGIPVPWSFFTGKYKNIEQGVADEVLKMRAEANAKIVKLQAETNRMIAETLLEMRQKTDAEIAISEHENTDELQQAWERSSAGICAAREKAYNERVTKLNTSFKKKGNTMLLNSQKEFGEIETQIAALKRRYAELSNKLPTLGFFKMGEKKKTAQQMEEIQVQLTALDEKKAEIKEQHEKNISELKEELKRAQSALEKTVTKDYPLEESPYERRTRLDYWKKQRADSLRDRGFVKEMLYYAFEYYDREINSDDFDEISEILTFTIELWPNEDNIYFSKIMNRQKVSAYISQLVKDEKVVRREDIRKAYFSLA